jgi:methylated-DNA-protein-cysteine methyltransferase related protein
MVTREDDLALAGVLEALRQGEVISYAELARRAGRPRAARWAARWLATLPEGHGLPWHRVVRADGRIAFAADNPSFAEQQARLQAEGVAVVDGRVRRLAGSGDLDALLFSGIRAEG